MNSLVLPHGGELKNLIVSSERAKELKIECIKLPSLDLTLRQQYDLELLMNGAFSPIAGFMKEKDYNKVIEGMRLESGTLWPIPVVLDVSEDFAKEVSLNAKIVLRDLEGVPLAIMTVTDIWRPDKSHEAEQVYGTKDKDHPGVNYLLEEAEPVYLGGPVEGLQLPSHHSFKNLRHTPSELRNMFAKWGWNRIAAFQTRNPMHRAHYELTLQAARKAKANLLLHPVVGPTKPGDVDYYTRVRCYKAILKHYPKQTTILSLLPLAMRMAGPREALWHAIIRKNYGCTQLIVGRDHAGPGKDRNGNDFYPPYAAQELVSKYEKELGIEMIPFEQMVYVKDLAQYMTISEVPKEAETLSLSGTELRRRLQNGLHIPEWFSFSEVIAELRKTFPERPKQGLTVFFTGLSGAGKSTIANALFDKLMEAGGRPVTLLDGDIVRKHLSSELGFSREHRDLNITRIGFVAAEITKNRGVAICAPIAPYDSTRKAVRGMVSPYGGFVLVHVSTPLEVCEQRDRKGLYAKARQGIIKNFTGVNDPYEEPKDASIVIDTTDLVPEEAAQRIFLHLKHEGYI